MVGLLIEFPLTYRPLTTIILYHTFKKMSIVKLHKLSQIFGTVFVQFDGAPGPPHASTYEHIFICYYGKREGIAPLSSKCFCFCYKVFHIVLVYKCLNTIAFGLCRTVKVDDEIFFNINVVVSQFHFFGVGHKGIKVAP